MRRKLAPISFNEALPRLVTIYEKGKLAPFVGSGLSAPNIPTWRDFLLKLADHTESKIDLRSSLSGSDLARVSEKVVTRLMRLGPEKFKSAVKDSLGYTKKGKPKATIQTQILSSIWWPLILTTNYDTMLYDSYLQNHTSGHHKRTGQAPIFAYGRGKLDCHSLLSQVETPLNTVYWALQGFIGRSKNHADLSDEIVLGYRQYRSVTFDNHIFRTTFSEVFRNHSFLFIGSGFSEEYFRGLFGEVLEKFGVNPHPHFALFNKSDFENENVDHHFLQTKLNIIPVYYEDKENEYDGLPIALDRFRNEISSSKLKLSSIGYSKISSSKLSSKKAANRLEIKLGPLPSLVSGECAIISAGYSNRREKLLLSEVGIKEYGNVIRTSTPVQMEKSRIWRFGESDVFAAVARNIDSGKSSYDSRDLRTISEAVSEAVDVLGNKYSAIYCMLLAAGKGRIFPPVFSLIQMIRGVAKSNLDFSTFVVNVVRSFFNPVTSFFKLLTSLLSPSTF